MLPVTSLYAGLFGLLFTVLSVRAIRLRSRYGLTLGTSHRLVERAVRAQGNFAEYVPFALLMIALCEINGLPDWALHVLGTILLAGRLVHAYGISQEPERITWRAAGMGLTFAMMGAASAALLGLALATL